MTAFFRNLTPRAIILSGCLLALLYAFFSRGVYHPDEHAQVLEFAHMKLFGTDPTELAWEYQLMMRPALQPLIAYGVGWVLVALDIYTPGLLVFLLHVLSAGLSVAALLVFYRTVQGALSENERKWFLGLSFFLWFMAYMHVRFSSEMFAGNFLLLLLAFFIRYNEEPSRRAFLRGLALGLLAGAAFAFRFQIGFALLGFGIWLLFFARRWKLLLGLGTGVVVMLAIATLTDYWLYGTWTCAPVNYLRENIINAHMESFGIDPWHYYLINIPIEGGILYGLLALVATVWFFVRHPRHVITWTLIPYLLVHQFLGHKEVRFLFPLLPLTPYFIVLIFRDIPRRWTQHRVAKGMLWLAIGLNALAILFHLTVDNSDISFVRMMQRRARGADRIEVMQLKRDRTYYNSWEEVIYPRQVIFRFYMPDNMTFRSFDGEEELQQALLSARTVHGTEIFLLSGRGDLANTALQPGLSETPSSPTASPAATSQPGLSGPAASPLTGPRPIPPLIEKVAWNPYPRWVIRQFNFNNWVEKNLRTKNIYRIEPRQ